MRAVGETPFGMNRPQRLLKVLATHAAVVEGMTFSSGDHMFSAGFIRTSPQAGRSEPRSCSREDEALR
jgi:hypothetical protein